MIFILVIITLMLLADGLWWFYADRQLSRRGIGRAWRWGVGAWCGVMIVGILLLVTARVLGMRAMIMPEYAVVTLFIWHFLLLPVLLVPSILHRVIGAVAGFVRRSRAPAPLPSESRRAFLAGSLVVVPPLATLALTGKAALDADDFVIRRVNVPLRQLPRGLDGMTIAFVSDPHLGSFMSDRKYNALIAATNNLDADLVLHGGDLINSSLLDLPDGLDMLRRFRSRYGVLSCEGNHDCIQSRETFERKTTLADVNMLLDEIRDVRVRGQRVQIIAPRWPRQRNDIAVMQGAAEVIARREPSRFAIQLAHHPHTFDPAAAAGVPLTLAGHTHGGQIGLSPKLSIGALMYRYYSGEYRQRDCALTVSNGVGNWFPLRVNVPAEIVHLTLACA